MLSRALHLAPHVMLTTQWVNSKYYVFMLENWDRIYRISIFQSWIGAYILAYIRTRVRCWPVTRTSDRTNKNDGDNPLPFVSGGHAPLRRHRPHHPSCPHQSPPAHQHWPVGGLNLVISDSIPSLYSDVAKVVLSPGRDMYLPFQVYFSQLLQASLLSLFFVNLG